VTNTGVSQVFANAAAATVNRAVSGDFNGDGLGDICLAVNASYTYGCCWGEIVTNYYCEFSNGDGSFNYTSWFHGGGGAPADSFGSWAASAGVQSVGAY
jgi:hypothetical protein